jgi:hypothetical protein
MVDDLRSPAWTFEELSADLYVKMEDLEEIRTYSNAIERPTKLSNYPDN